MILRVLEDESEGILINGNKINNIRYADDTILLAQSQEGLQKLFNKLDHESVRLGLSINAKKTKTMVISKSSPEPACSIKHGTTEIEQVSHFNYLGSLVTSDGRSRKEIRRRIILAKKAFDCLRPILTDRKLSMHIRTRLLKCYVWSTLLYGCESWTFTVETRNNIAASEMWFYRRMLRISYKDRVTNDEVLKRIRQERQLLKVIEKRQISFMGHIIRKNELENLALSGKIEGSKARGGQRKTLMDNFPKSSVREIWDKARQRKKPRDWRFGFV